MIYNNKEIKTTKHNGVNFCRLQDVCEILKYKNPTMAFNRHCNNKIMLPTQTSSGIQNCIFINEENLISLINKSYTLTYFEKNDFLLFLQENGFIKSQSYIKTRQETEFFDLFEKTLIVFNYEYIRQYSIFDYIVDFYIKDLNVVIEYDEFHHKYQQEKDLTREKAIKKELKCKIIRISSNDTHLWNIGYLFKNLFL